MKTPIRPALSGIALLSLALLAPALRADLGGASFQQKLTSHFDKAWDATIDRLKALPQRVGGGHVPPARRVRKDRADLQHVSLAEVRNLRLLGHANQPLKLLMVLSTETMDEVQEVLEVVREMNGEPGASPLRLHLIVQSRKLLSRLDTTPEDFERHLELDPFFRTDDLWMQDWGEVVAASLEGADKERLLVFDTQRGRGLAPLPASLARMWSGAYLKAPPPKRAHAGNYGGNIEVTPDDMLVIGDTSDAALRDLLADVGYAGRTVTLETSWLLVGHVDEYLSLVPTPGTAAGYTLVKASPNLALHLLRTTPPKAFAKSLTELPLRGFRRLPQFPDRLPGRDDAPTRRIFQQLAGLHAFLHGAAGSGDDDAAERLMHASLRATQVIDRNVAKLAAALEAANGGHPLQVASVPVLFQEKHGKLVSLLPDVANMVVLREHLLIPDPLLPEFRSAARDVFLELGMKPHFVPNLSYHNLEGQLHCGTNVFRHPNKYVHPRYAKEAAQRRKFRQLDGRVGD